MKHNADKHPETPLQTEYSWTVLKTFKKCLDRIIYEAILIQESFEKEESDNKFNCLNSKTENKKDYSRNQIPGLTKYANEEGKLKQEELTNKIKELRKTYNKNRGRDEEVESDPKNKRRKLDQQPTGEQNTGGPEDVGPHPGDHQQEGPQAPQVSQFQDNNILPTYKVSNHQGNSARHSCLILIVVAAL